MLKVVKAPVCPVITFILTGRQGTKCRGQVRFKSQILRPQVIELKRINGGNFTHSFCSHANRVFMPPEEFLRAKDHIKDPEKDCNLPENRTAEDVIFDMFAEPNGLLSVSKFLAALYTTGLRKTDPRLKEMINKLRVIWKAKEEAGTFEALFLDKESFSSVIKENIVLISRALRHHFVIPDFQDFAKHIEKFYYNCKVINDGKVADYIPQLAKYNPEYWGVCICTIDGQRYSIGDTEVTFTIQSSGKPINYAIALNDLGPDIVHSYIGREPSGRMFNELVLDYNRKPHNPMVNAGAIVVCSLLLYLVEKLFTKTEIIDRSSCVLTNFLQPEMRVSEKFDWVCNYFKAMAGGEYLGFSNATFLSEREAADRNFAIAYYMKEHKCFPEKANLKEVMDFYFQMCSLEVNCQTVSVIASTLANGGICPITGEQVISSQAVRDVLSLMHSCGMYDYSGQFAFTVGMPAKSGVSGCTMVVVPNVMGLGLFSPPLDIYGNSVRGVHFCEELVSVFNFHHYDNLRHVPHKKDPRRQKFETRGLKIVSLLFSAASGDVSAMRRHYLSGMEMGLSDYDGRTAMHLAASEGHLEVIEFLINVCQVNPSPKDRWGHTPLDEAQRFNHKAVADFLQNLKPKETG